MRPIDSDKLYERREIMHDCYGLDHTVVRYTNIEAAPTLTLDDIVPHGRWESTSVLVGCMKFEYYYQCTACGRSGGKIKTHYCPNCGAKMDLEE